MGEFDIGVKMEFVDGGAATTTTPLKLFPTPQRKSQSTDHRRRKNR